jgi:hypothetical protein
VGKREPELLRVLPEREQPYPVFLVYHKRRARSRAAARTPPPRSFGKPASP